MQRRDLRRLMTCQERFKGLILKGFFGAGSGGEKEAPFFPKPP
jgi:hypothetical protein